MAGSINLSLSQQFDITNGRLLASGKLYFFSPGTTTPQNAFRDSGLTLPHPNPITLQSDGRVPQLYFADGSIRCRLLNSAGVVQFDADNILVIGPSSGGGGGASVDPNAIFQTGDVMWLDVTGTRAGWVRDNGRTIGNGVSGASERGNADTQALFLFLYAAYLDAVCPVSGGRSGNALNDFNAGKQITLPDKRGYVAGGMDDMGNAAAGRYSGVPFGSGNALTAGSPCGETSHTLTVSQLPVHTPSGAVTGTVNGVWTGSFTSNSAGGVSAQLPNVNTSLPISASFAGDPIGGGLAANVTQHTIVGTFYRKL